MAFALNSKGYKLASSTSATASLATISSGDIVFAFMTCNGSPITGITSPNLTWSLYTTGGSIASDTNYAELWYAVAGSDATSESIVVTQTSSAFLFVSAFSITPPGANWQFDPNVSVPQTSETRPMYMSTDGGDGIIIAGFRQVLPGVTQEYTGWTPIHVQNTPASDTYAPGSYTCTEYVLVSAPQSSRVIDYGYSQDQNGCIATALTMPLAGSAAATRGLIPPPPVDWFNAAEHRRKLATSLQGVLEGRTNNGGTVTLTASTTTTTVANKRVGADSLILFMPQTANAAGVHASLYVSSRGAGTFTITHASTSSADMTFDYAIVGTGRLQ